MRVNEALKIYGQSVTSYKARLTELEIKDLIELVQDLRLVNHPEVFNISHDILMKDKLTRFYRAIDNLEKSATGEEGIEELRDYIREKTGFDIGSKTSPSAGLRRLINEITNWAE